MPDECIRDQIFRISIARGEIWLGVTQGDVPPSRKGPLQFRELETAGESTSPAGRVRRPIPALRTSR